MTGEQILWWAKGTALKIARALEYQGTVVADLKRQGRGTKRAEKKERRLRDRLREADAAVAAITSINKKIAANNQKLAASDKKIAAFEARAVYLLSAGDISRKPAAEILVQNVSRKVGAVFAAGGTRKDARAAALKQFKETAAGLADPWFKEVAGRLNDLAGIGL